MRFDWDERKNASNLKKHGVLFETAALVFDEPSFVMTLDRVVDGEERWQTVGRAGRTMLLLVVHLLDDEDGEEAVRIVSARKATAHERRRYESRI